MTVLDYPVWLRVDHWLNVLFVTLIIRSGIEILSTHPKLYWHDDSKPGTEWARFTRKVMPRDRIYDTLDEEEDYHPLISLPGHAQLGMGRHWHFFAVIGWVLVGLSYYVLLFATGQWHRYWPYSWSVFPEAFNDIVTYLTFNLPPVLPGEPLDAMQKLTYAGWCSCWRRSRSSPAPRSPRRSRRASRGTCGCGAVGNGPAACISWGWSPLWCSS